MMDTSKPTGLPTELGFWSLVGGSQLFSRLSSFPSLVYSIIRREMQRVGRDGVECQVVEVAGGVEDTFLRAHGKVRPQLKSKEGFENLMVSPHPQLSQNSRCIPGGTCPSLLLASCVSSRLMLDCKGLFPSKGMGLLYGSCRRTTECPNRALGFVLGKDIAPLVPRQPRCVVEGNTFQWLQDTPPWPGEGFGTA